MEFDYISYLIFCAVMYVSLKINILGIESELRRRGYNERQKRGFWENVSSELKLLTMALIPVINAFALVAVVFYRDDIMNRVIERHKADDRLREEMFK